MTTFNAQRIKGGAVPTYGAVSLVDYVNINAITFLHIIKGSVGYVDGCFKGAGDIITISDINGANAYTTPIANETDITLGPFDFGLYSNAIKVTHTNTLNVIMAALYSAPMYPIEAAELTTANGAFSTTPTILAGVLPSATVEIGG